MSFDLDKLPEDAWEYLDMVLREVLDRLTRVGLAPWKATPRIVQSSNGAYSYTASLDGSFWFSLWRGKRWCAEIGSGVNFPGRKPILLGRGDSIDEALHALKEAPEKGEYYSGMAQTEERVSGLGEVVVKLDERENENGRMQRCTIVTCVETGVEVQVWGTSERSATRGKIMLNGSCTCSAKKHVLPETETGEDQGDE